MMLKDIISMVATVAFGRVDSSLSTKPGLIKNKYTYKSKCQLQIVLYDKNILIMVE